MSRSATSAGRARAGSGNAARVDRRGIPALAYHRLTDERSFRAMRDLFDETFAEPTLTR